MRLGYPCLNYGLKPLRMRTFRLANYSEARLEEAVTANLAYVERMLAFNVEHGLLFYRLSSDLVPFASHPVCRFDWRRRFAQDFRRLGRFLRANGFRVSMHPAQFVVLNGEDEGTLDRSLKELQYHAQVLDSLELDETAKIQLHVGGVYGDRAAAMRRFVARHAALPSTISRRLVIENDERSYPLADCLRLHEETGVPVLFDAFHHEILNHGESWAEALALAARTWGEADGAPLVDYSSQQPGARSGAHCATIDLAHFGRFVAALGELDVDLMLEIKDKETSALKAAAALRELGRLPPPPCLPHDERLPPATSDQPLFG